MDKSKKLKIRSSAPCKEEIFEAQNKLGHLDKIMIRYLITSDGDTCWACGGYFPDGGIERAHIIAKSHGGSFEPNNFFILCCFCHEVQPDSLSVESQWNWLYNAETQLQRFSRQILEIRTECTKIVKDDGKEFDVWLMELITQGKFFTVPRSAGPSNGFSNLKWAAVEQFKNWKELKALI